MKTKEEKQLFLKKLIPFSLTVLVILADQITKILVAKNIPPYTVLWSFWDGLLRIIHVRNLGVAFSMGYSWPVFLRKLVFSLIPLVVIAYVIRVYFKSNEFSDVQRWCICGVIGGGIGNLIDRIFRPDGVVDFIDVKFFGLFGMERWPTFNIADAVIVVCGIILIISFIAMILKDTKKK